MKLVDTFGFNAPAEILFDTITDPQRVPSWLPTGTRLTRIDGECVTLTIGGTTSEYTSEYRYGVDAKRMRVVWQRAGSDLCGVAAVQDGPIGGSRLRISAITADSPDAPRRFHELVDSLVRRLERAVDDVFTAG